MLWCFIINFVLIFLQKKIMIEYVKGNITELTPTYVVVETAGVGYFCNISLTTYTKLQGQNETKVYVYESIREDAHSLFGFYNKKERELFLLLISTSGVGANTARVILSSYNPEELANIIASGDVNSMNKIKGIGLKTAQRLILDLKEKVLKLLPEDAEVVSVSDSTGVGEEAVMALTMLGYTAANAKKAVEKVVKQEPGLAVEQIIKKALKLL